MKDLRSGVSPSNVWQTLVDSAAALENYDATKQLGSYKNSIKLGHSAIVIAHSQGNLFTNVVYEKIATDSNDKWMTKYFYMIGVASPAGVGTGPKGIEIVTFDNDPITNIPDSIGTPITNPMRYIVWDSDDNSRTSPCLNGFYPDGTVVSPCELGLDSGHPWFAFDNDKIDFHLFSYYMDTNKSKTKIINFVDTSLKSHSEAKSQWIQKEETNKNTCDYKITVKHKEDPSVEMPLEVYPFNALKKLYQVNGEYVKASCGGENILETWDGKKDNECLMIDNVEEEKIGEACPNPSLFEVISQENPNTKDWRVTVKNNETNETQSGVYPFNLSGSLYQLESGEWVLASCGGKTITESWAGQEMYEFYRINNLQMEKIVMQCTIKISYYALERPSINGSYSFNQSDSYGVQFGNIYTYKFTIIYDNIEEVYIAYSGEKGWEDSCGQRFVVAKDSGRYGAPNNTTSFDIGNLRLPDEW